MVQVTCIKCGREGSLTKKQTVSKGITYEYWYVEHHIGKKIKWCYLGKFEKLPEQYKQLIHKNTQNIRIRKEFSDSENKCAEVIIKKNVKPESLVAYPRNRISKKLKGKLGVRTIQGKIYLEKI